MVKEEIGMGIIGDLLCLLVDIIVPTCKGVMSSLARYSWAGQNLLLAGNHRGLALQAVSK